MKHFLPIFLLSALFSEFAATGTSCPAGFATINRKKCLRVFNNRLKHLEAEIDCTYLGGTLVTVKNAADNRAVTNFAANAGANNIWLGMFCFANQNTSLCYHDDNSGALSYSNFGEGFPKVDQTSGGCVYMSTSGPLAGQWYSAQCEVIGMPFVCEVPMTNVDKTCTHNYNGYCYMPSHEMSINTKNTTYSSAQNICRMNSANLVSIHSKPEVDYIRGIYRNSGINNIFLGAQALLPELFEWVDGTSFDYDYSDPLIQGIYPGNCLQMDLTNRPNNGMWSNLSCQKINFFLCKRKIPVPSGKEKVLEEDQEEEQKEEEKTNPKFQVIRKKNEAVSTHLDFYDYSHCNTTLYLGPGVITSYGYPAKPIATFCTWKLAVIGPYRAGLYFTNFSVAADVYVRDEYGNLIGDQQGTRYPFSVLAPTNILTVTHDSRYDNSWLGFSATILPY